jgi:hypothetical protein
MKKSLYYVAIALVLVFLYEEVVAKLANLDPILPRPVKIILAIIAILFFGFHYYKKQKP